MNDPNKVLEDDIMDIINNGRDANIDANIVSAEEMHGFNTIREYEDYESQLEPLIEERLPLVEGIAELYISKDKMKDERVRKFVENKVKEDAEAHATLYQMRQINRNIYFLIANEIKELEPHRIARMAEMASEMSKNIKELSKTISTNSEDMTNFYKNIRIDIDALSKNEQLGKDVSEEEEESRTYTQEEVLKAINDLRK